MKKLVFAVLSLISSSSFAGGEVSAPPELPPRDAVDFEQGLTGPEALKPTKEPKPNKEPKDTCGPKKDYIEGKCVCESVPCKPKIVEKKVYVEKPVIKEIIREKPVIRQKTIVKDRPVEKVIERPVDRIVTRFAERIVTRFVEHHHMIQVGYGRGPEGVAPVLYERRDSRKEYKFYQEYGNVWAGMYTYSFTAFENVPMSASLLYISNDTKMGFVGFSF